MTTHDEMAYSIGKYFMDKEEFGNVFISSVVPSFPRPDFVFISREKEPKPPIAFEFKPPNAVKREYLTGLGQSISYLNDFPYSYLIIPNQKIDDLFLPTYFLDVIDNSDLKIGLISYNTKSFIPKIEREALINPKIPVDKITKEFNETRSWAYWRETTPTEVLGILQISFDIYKENQESSKELIMNKFWDEILGKKYHEASESTEKAHKLNYKLYLDYMGIWSQNGVLTTLGNRMREIGNNFGNDSNEFLDAMTLCALTEGGHYLLLKNVHEIQSTKYFENKGNVRELLDKLEAERKSHLHVTEDMDILEYFVKSDDESTEWLKVISCELYRRGFGQSISRIIDEMSRFFPSYYNSLETNLLLSNYIKSKGFPINWAKISSLLESKEKIMNVLI